MAARSLRLRRAGPLAALGVLLVLCVAQLLRFNAGLGSVSESTVGNANSESESESDGQALSPEHMQAQTPAPPQKVLLAPPRPPGLEQSSDSSLSGEERDGDKSDGTVPLRPSPSRTRRREKQALRAAEPEPAVDLSTAPRRIEELARRSPESLSAAELAEEVRLRNHVLLDKLTRGGHNVRPAPMAATDPALVREWLRESADVEADPLDDERLHPGSVLSLESAALCDHELNVVLPKAWTCPEDPTCVKCAKSSVTRFRELEAAFAKTADARMKDMAAQFGDPRADPAQRQVVVVSAVNEGQLYLFLNWVCSCAKIGLRAQDFTVVVPTDTVSATTLRELGFFVVDPAWTEGLSRPIMTGYVGHANAGAHADINNVVVLVATEVLCTLRHDILLHDVDIVWMRDVRPYLLKAAARRDVVAMGAPFWVTKGGINTGFVMIRNTYKSRAFMQSVKNLAPVKKLSDQELFNNVLRHFAMFELERRILPDELFYRYNGRKAPAPNENMVVYHAVGMHKRSSHLYHGVWRYTPDCPVYDALADVKSLRATEEVV